MTGSDTALATFDASSPPAALVPVRLGGWTCSRLTLEGDDRLSVRFQAAGGTDWVEVTVLPREAPGAVFRRLDHCAVRYRGSVAERTPERLEEVGALVASVGDSVDALLAVHPAATLAEALGRTRRPGRVVFGRDALRDLLSPQIVEGAPLTEGFTLVDVYPSSHLQQSHEDLLELVLDFRRDADGRRMLIVVRRRDDTRPAFARTAHFSLSHLSLGAADPAGADAVRALVGFVLQLHDHDALDVVFPDVVSDVAPALPAPESVPDLDPDEAALNLAIDADCGQQCNFCSVKDTAPAEDGGDRAFARLSADLTSNRQRGVRALRINGYDPLAYSRILDVMHHATALGYTSVDVFSPFTRAADPAFRDAIVDALPPGTRWHVPLYALRPEVHDRVVGRPGAHALVLRAIELLAERVPVSDIRLSAVTTRINLRDVAEVAAWARGRGLPFHAHLPFPSFESRGDRFFGATPRLTEVADMVATAHGEGLRLAVLGLVPCVSFRRMGEAGVPVRAWLEMGEEMRAVPGTEYSDGRIRHRAAESEHAAFRAASVGCPHVSACVLASACPGAVLRGYAEAYGLDELQPVSLRALVEAT